MDARWLNRLEHRFGDWAVPNLPGFIVGMNAVIYVLMLIQPEFVRSLTLSPALILSGEVWRAFTFIFIPPGISPLWMFFWLYLLFIYASALEQEWGEFKFNVFYGIGALATIIVSLFMGVGLTNTILNTTIFLAFAALNPDFEILLFFILPVKVKYLAWLGWGMLGWNFLASGWIYKFAILAGVSNYLIFFGPHHLGQILAWRKIQKHRQRYKDAFKD